jgi:haloalkane dehalogenase
MAIWGKEDMILTLASGQRLASSIGRQIDHVVEDAGHGIQEDQGPLIGGLVADWLASRP